MADVHGAHAARGVVAPTVRYSPRDEVDYVIVGAGAAGGVMARELAMAGACVVVAIVFFARARKLDMVALGDIVASAAPIGLFFGRIANFVNGELWGKPSDAPWAMVFPHDAAQLPRHPSQLYEAGLEGLVLFAVLSMMMFRFNSLRRPGLNIAVFWAGSTYFVYTVSPQGLTATMVRAYTATDTFLGFLELGQTGVAKTQQRSGSPLPLKATSLLLLLLLLLPLFLDEVSYPITSFPFPPS